MSSEPEKIEKKYGACEECGRWLTKAEFIRCHIPIDQRDQHYETLPDSDSASEDEESEDDFEDDVVLECYSCAVLRLESEKWGVDWDLKMKSEETFMQRAVRGESEAWILVLILILALTLFLVLSK